MSFFLNHAGPGQGAGAHRHPYPEVFAILEGETSFTVDGATIRAHGGQVLVVPAGAVHEFANAGSATLEMVQHPSRRRDADGVDRGVMSPRDRGALSGALAGPAFVAGVAGAMGMSSEPYPRPGADAEAVRRFFGKRPSPMLVSVPGQLVSAVALGRFAASVAGLARGSALRAAAVAGGAVAAGSLAVSAAHGVALAAPRAAWLIPAGRFPGLVVCAIAGKTLARG